MSQPPPRIVIPGGAGYLGGFLVEHFARLGWEVVVLTRQPVAPISGARSVAWDGRARGDWARELDGAAALVNLAGRSVNCRYHAHNRAVIYASRLESTRVLGAALAACSAPPPVWVNASSATIYRHALDRPMDERTGELGSGFSVDVCRKWEQTLWDAPTPATRKVALRSALVLGPGKGGALHPLHRLACLGLGGPMAGGRQWVSWVHAADFAGAVAWVVGCEALSGPINCASSHPVPNREFMRTLRRVCGRPFGLPAARWMLELGAFVLGTETELLLKSRWVVPTLLLESGFRFRYPELEPALHALLAEP